VTRPLRNQLRIALPPLDSLGPDAPLEYAWFDRRGRRAGQGEMTLAALSHAYPHAACDAVLHPADVIAASVRIPALPAGRVPAAVRGALEPLVLSDLDALAIGHGPRAGDGAVPVAWTAREPLRRAWSLLAARGLRVRSLTPAQSLVPASEAPLRGPDDPRWLAPAPGWSLALPQLAPASGSRWRGARRWGAAAAAVWIAGLNLHAVQLRGEARALREAMTRQVREAFPGIAVVLDPARQARQGLEALQAERGAAGAAGFLSQARAAAQALPFAQERVVRLGYDGRALTLQLDAAGPPLPTLVPQAAAQGLKLERGDSDLVWRLSRNPQ